MITTVKTVVKCCMKGAWPDNVGCRRQRGTVATFLFLNQNNLASVFKPCLNILIIFHLLNTTGPCFPAHVAFLILMKTESKCFDLLGNSTVRPLAMRAAAVLQVRLLLFQEAPATTERSTMHLVTFVLSS